MKRKLLTILLSLITALCLCFGLAACDDGSTPDTGTADKDTEQGAPQTPDEDDKDPDADEDKDPDGGDDKDPDVDDDKDPDDGGDDKDPDVDDDKDPSEDDDDSGEHVHTFTVDNVCNKCGTAWEYTDGLAYELDPETDTYIVAKNDGVSGDVVIPYGYQGKWVTSIGKDAFSGCKSLTSIEVPNSVTSIGEGAFELCRSLTSITLCDSVTSIGNGAFYGTAYYNNLNNWDSSYVLYIGNHLIKAKDIISGGYIIRENTKTIADYAFYYCSGLTSIEIPNSVTSIGYSAFAYCSGLTSVTIPDSVTSIGDWAFVECRGLTSITIPDSVTEIGQYAFCRCSGLTSIIIPDGVTSIGQYAFRDCCKLVEVWNYSDLDIKVGESNYGYVAYYAKQVYTTNEASKQTSTDDGYLFYENENDSYLIAYRGNETNLTLPAKSPNGRDYQINQYTFYDCRMLTSINIPDSVTEIGNYAFEYCSALTSVTIPNSVTSIGDGAFYLCSGLTTVTIGNGVTSIGDSAFYDCSGLTSVTIGSGVTSIEVYAFYFCRGLTDIQFKGTVKEWQAIQKEEQWDYRSGNYTITCTDGTIDKNGTVTHFAQ